MANPIEVAETDSDTSAVVHIDSTFVGNGHSQRSLIQKVILSYACYSLLNAAKYCPMNAGLVVTAVTAFGLEGVWQLQNLDFVVTDEEVKANVESATFPLQPIWSMHSLSLKQVYTCTDNAVSKLTWYLDLEIGSKMKKISLDSN